MSTSVIHAVRDAAATWEWSPTHRATVQREYERFLDLVEAHPGVPLVPANDVDLVWHEHLSAHGTDRPPPAHDPHSTPDHDLRFARTIELYRARYGEPNELWDLAAICQVDDEPPPPAPRLR